MLSAVTSRAYLCKLSIAGLLARSYLTRLCGSSLGMGGQEAGPKISSLISHPASYHIAMKLFL